MGDINKDSILSGISNDDTYNTLVEVLSSEDFNVLFEFYETGEYEGQSVGVGDGFHDSSFNRDGGLEVFGDEGSESFNYSVNVIERCMSAAIRGTGADHSVGDQVSLYEDYFEFTRDYIDRDLPNDRAIDRTFEQHAALTFLVNRSGESQELRESVRFHFVIYERLIYKEEKSAFVFAKHLLDRIRILKDAIDDGLDIDDDEAVSEIEDRDSAENSEINLESTQPLLLLYAAAEFFGDPSVMQNTPEWKDTVRLSFTESYLPADYDSDRLSGYFNIFSVEDISMIENLDRSFQASLFETLEESGLLELAAYYDNIGAFAKKRFASISNLEKLATDYVDADVDVLWQTQAATVINKLKSNPIMFMTIQYYFPSLITFLLDALSTVVDYSNGGQGGGLTEERREEFIDSLEKAFGINQQTGEAIFTLAFMAKDSNGNPMNTNERIKQVLDSSPFRENNAPINPDIFHLRLGAANFYVPPLSIDVNTQFKAGSLTGGAIRQRNTPKFNSGYKETNISMRLFFPNYLEIWGITLDPTTTIDLNSDFELNFKKYGDSDEKIDKFLSSLRGLVAAFKYSPILPIKNHYLNSVHGITATALQSMSISTVPNFPFALAVDINLLNFDHEPFLPMIKDFNQAIHWGKYRTYMGRAAESMHSYINENFLIKEDGDRDDDTVASGVDIEAYPDDGAGLNPIEAQIFGVDDSPEIDMDIMKINILNEWRNGNHLSLYIPAETQTKLFLPDTSSFRTDQEDLHNDLNEPLWAEILQKYGLDLNESNSYGISFSEARDLSLSKNYSMSSYDLVKNSLDILTAGINAEDTSEAVYNELITGFIISNRSSLSDAEESWLREWNPGGSEQQDFTSYTTEGAWYFSGNVLSDGTDNYTLDQAKKLIWAISKDSREYFDQLIDSEIKRIKDTTDAEYVPRDRIEDEIKKAFNISLYERFFQNGFVQGLMEAVKDRTGSQRFNEWEVPMNRVDLDPDSVVIRGVSLTMANNFARMQVQMQDEPAYQFIGGRDTVINMSMTVFGESELIKLKRIFDHVSGLARLEHATGVLGFLGIKNVITALSGVKYVIPMNYQVTTIPNYPHAYNVNLTLVDFDVFQQKREQLSSATQKEMVKEFMTKKNPFLRIKQMWGSFNAYPDLPLYIKDENGEVVGNLDPDFYFRSFQTYDNDVIHNFSQEISNIENYNFSLSEIQQVQAYLNSAIDDVLETYGDDGVDAVAEQLITLLSDTQISRDFFETILRNRFNHASTDSVLLVDDVLTECFRIADNSSEDNIFMEEVTGSPFIVGDLSASSSSALQQISAALESGLSSDKYTNEYGNEVVPTSFHPDEVEFHHIITLLSAVEQEEIDKDRVPAMLQTAAGIHFGYMNRTNGRFYFNSETDFRDEETGETTSRTTHLRPRHAKDIQVPQTAFSEDDGSASGIPGVSAVQDYQKAYDGSEHEHWEKMMVDANYRDVSGRMIRAFPTYMLWLIDEGGYFAGVKLFDNFYGLQSIIDFSVVSSEDILGDTLIFRVSNLYSKLTTPESNKIFNPNIGQDEDTINLNEGLSGVVDLILNRSRNILAHMRHEYVVDVNNIRLKPGVRVHLRAGYGSNPNSLQTLFNGVITNVEQGEIVTITAQSDAIELGAVVNSTNKNGDSGKIDGGIDTGMYLSEPRDLMIRLLSMGASRTREAIAHATKGVIFSENKFGIRHFGNMLYEPINDADKAKHDALRNAMADALLAVGNSDLNPLSLAASAAVEVGRVGLAVNPVAHSAGQALGFGSSIRGGVVGAIGRAHANLNSQIDFEIYKRNIYPGNGTGVAQFMGGDLDDGWVSTASISPASSVNERLERDLGFVTDVTWNKMLQSYERGELGANATYGVLTEGKEVFERDPFFSKVGASVVAGGLLAGAASFAAPVTFAAGLGIGTGLLGTLSGKTGNNFFRLMGVISPNADDDLPGFDEVSFRAQTYMRSVWEVFQTCARLLPNYIVAVRPFEDRSTLFYGKPHWLYTSGVVPVTTGFPGEDRAGLGPKIREPDLDFLDIMDRVNAETNPLADYAAYFNANETSEVFKNLAEAERNGTGIFAPTSYFRGKVINFYDDASLSYYKVAGSGEIGRQARLPTARPMLTVGPHLPVDIQDQGRLSVSVAEMKQDDRHVQIVNLPPRYSINIFSDFLLDEAGEGLSYNYVSGGSFLKSLTGRLVESDLPGIYFTGTYNDLLTLEDKFLGEDEGSPGDDDYVAKQRLISSSGVFDFDKPLILDELTKQSVIGIDDSIEITMPLPSQQGKNDLENSLDQIAEYHDETGLLEYSQDGKFLTMYDHWTAPTSVEDEQFYIAMRWPYDPQLDEGEELFKEQYGINEFYGTVEDYKDRKVLVYSPATRRAVICKPAYFYWGESRVSDGAVSPDAAYYLGIITGPTKSGFKRAAEPMPCYTAFVPDHIPVGVISDRAAPAYDFELMGDSSTEITSYPTDYGVYGSSRSNFLSPNDYGSVASNPSFNTHIIGFGHFSVSPNSDLESLKVVSTNSIPNSSYRGLARWSSLSAYSLAEGVDSIDPLQNLQYGGNPYLANSGAKNFVDAVVQGLYEDISQDRLRDTLEDEIGDINESRANGGSGRISFAYVYDNTDSISVDARKFYDEKFDSKVSVIAGDGRTIHDAQEIWDQFRYQYHEQDSVKEIFTNFYGFDPDSEEQFPDFFQSILSGQQSNFVNPFSVTGNSAVDEFALILGSDFVDRLQDSGVAAISKPSPNAPDEYNDTRMLEAIEYARQNFIDAPLSQGGLIESINSFMVDRLSSVRDNFILNTTLREASLSSLVSLSSSDDDDNQDIDVDFAAQIRTPKQLFLLMVAAFRQTMWENPYARAWVVLKPDLRTGKTGLGARGTRWSLKPLDVAFRAFIDPYGDYASNESKLLSLLTATRGEGNSSGNMFAYAIESTSNFFEANVAPIYNAIADSLDGLLATFRLSTQQMGYALQEASAFRRHANVMNKAFNDSIYYSLGREGSLLRGVDNPFTREYGEPVLEVREPFQKIHYISSFSHILNNQIQENLNNVATVVTGVSDGKYPVTVALDKGAPAERQVEKTVETGIYFDNAIGEGVLGIIHPIMHPFETFRGFSKAAQGTPDELTARRIALAHLKESIKDIYQGELIVIGNPDIRPHDLVYLSDVYERMYGIFEVEQVVHNFTPELGFITSITPNALVTVNDPARWFLTSWINSWLSKQSIRNNARVIIDRAKAGSSGLSLSGQVSMDRLAQVLEPDIVGGMQFTHGSSALVRDAVAMQTATSMPDSREALAELGAGRVQGGAAAAATATVAGTLVGGISAALAPFTLGTSLAVGAAVSSTVTQLAWKGWSWVRDNLLDQHGCYVQYLSKNGQPMDAGLSYNQGMVVGKHHSKALLPGVLGVRRKVRTVDGHAYVRTDDLFKSMGWKEVEIDSFVRYVSYENALVHARVLNLSGLSPDKASLSNVFKVLARVVNIIGGDLITVEDIISNKTYNVRLDGIETERVNEIGVRVDSSLSEVKQELVLADASTPAAKSVIHVAESLKDKVFVIRINESQGSNNAVLDQDYDPGSSVNKVANYQKDDSSNPNTLGTVFYHLPSDWVYSAIYTVSDILRGATSGDREALVDGTISITPEQAQEIADQLNIDIEDVGELNWLNLPGVGGIDVAPLTYVTDFVNVFKYTLDDDSPFFTNFNAIYSAIDLYNTHADYYDLGQFTSADPLYNLNDQEKKTFSNIVAMYLLNKLYTNVSEWPRVSWDQYHEDGTPYSLNWEMVTKNLASVQVSDLLKAAPSVIDVNESSNIPTYIGEVY